MSIKDSLDGGDGAFAIRVDTYSRSCVSDGMDDGAKFSSEYSLVTGAEWLVEVRGIVLRDVNGPPSTSKSVIVRVQQGAVGVHVSVVVVVVCGVSALGSANGFGFVGYGMQEFVVSVFLPCGVVRGEGRDVWAYAGMPPSVVVGYGVQLGSSEIAVVPTGFFDGVIDFVFSTLACFVVVRAMPEHVFDGVPLVAVGASVVVGKFSGLEAILSTN